MSATRTDKDNSTLWAHIGTVQAKLGKLSEAIFSFDKALSIDEHNTTAWLNKAAALGKMEENTEALQCYQTILDYEPENKYAWLGQGRIYLRNNELDKSKYAFERSLHIDPNFKLALDGSAELNSRIKEEETEAYAAKLLRFEHKRERSISRDEAARDVGIPENFLDLVNERLKSKEDVNISSMSTEEFDAYEQVSKTILLRTLGNPEYGRKGLYLSEVYTAMDDPNITKAKRILSYISQVNNMKFPTQAPDKETERLLRTVFTMPSEYYTTLKLMETLDIGIYMARQLMTIINSSNAASYRDNQGYSEEAYEPQPAKKDVSLFKKKQPEETRVQKPIDRSKAVDVYYTTKSAQYRGRNCIFHDEQVVAACPKCGTLMCMQCASNFESCPRCHIPLNFKSGEEEEQEGSEVVLTEKQIKAMHQKWAMKRMADAERTQLKKDSYHQYPKTDKEEMSTRLMRNAGILPEEPQKKKKEAPQEDSEEQSEENYGGRDYYRL